VTKQRLLAAKKKKTKAKKKVCCAYVLRAFMAAAAVFVSVAVFVDRRAINRSSFHLLSRLPALTAFPSRAIFSPFPFPFLSQASTKGESGRGGARSPSLAPAGCWLASLYGVACGKMISHRSQQANR